MPSQGTYLGTLEGVNHLDLVGWINTARYKWAEIMGREIKFKPTAFYLAVADHLARVAEAQPQEQEGASGDAETEEIRQEGERVEMAESLKKGAEHAGEEDIGVTVEDAGSAPDAPTRKKPPSPSPAAGPSKQHTR